MYKILIADDEQKIREVLREYAEYEGHEVVEAVDGMQAVELSKQEDFDIIILDIMMPRLDGFSACKEIRKFKQTPVLMLSARGEEYDKLFGFEIGADDYVVKPFGVSELLARIRSTLRRAERLKLSQGIQRDVYQIKDLTIDLSKHQILLGEQEVHFTQNEFKIIELLAIHAGKVLTYDFILEHIWGPYSGSGSNQILRVNMANIRRKLKENPSDPKYIHTELGIGYRMLDD